MLPLTVSDTPASEPVSSNPCQRTVGCATEKPFVSALTASSAPPPPFVTKVPAKGSGVGFDAIGPAPPQLATSSATSARHTDLRRIAIFRSPPGPAPTPVKPIAGSLRSTNRPVYPSTGQGPSRNALRRPYT